jgi:hypothetical protein
MIQLPTQVFLVYLEIGYRSQWLNGDLRRSRKYSRDLPSKMEHEQVHRHVMWKHDHKP